MTTEKDPESPEDPKLPKRVSIYDIAKAADVSPGTVSRVINNRDRVRASTRQKVLQAAKELKFKPQVTIRKPEIAIITEQGFMNRSNGYAATLVQHISYELTRLDYDIQLPEEAIETLKDAYFNGMIIVHSYGPHVQKLVSMLEHRIPTVFIDLFENEEEKFTVCSDHEQAGYLASSHFIQTGRKKPGFLGSNNPANRKRAEGFARGLTENGVDPDPSLIYLRPRGEAPYIGLNNLVRTGADGLFVPGASLEAIEALHILTYVMKKDVPREIALIGGENEQISSFLVPPLTTIEEPLEKISKRAVHMMENLLQGKTIENKREILPVRLIRRVSGG